MIIRDEPTFTIECDLDDEMSRAASIVLAGVFSEYRLNENTVNDPVGIDVDGIQFVIRYKNLS